MSELIGPGSKYSDEDRRRAAIEYALLGSVKKVSQTTGIPVGTLHSWRHTDWWHTVLAEVQTEKEALILAKNTEIIESSLSELHDRITKGDYVFNKAGEMVRRPMSGKDLAIVGGVSFDKRRLSLNLPTSINASGGTTDAIKKLAAEFQALSTRFHEKRANAIPGELAEAIDNQA